MGSSRATRVTLPTALTAWAVPTVAQQPTPQTPVFGSDVRVVAVPVFVTDKGGRAVPGLSAADFEIEDQGIGISPEALAKLFQPFERIDTHLRVKTPGTGLGLYLTRKIMTDLLYGDVQASSKEGAGSTFTLWLPLTIPSSQADGAKT